MRPLTFKDFEKLKSEPSTIIVDVRDEYPFQKFNYGGINIPSHQLTQRLNELKDYENIIVVCESGTIASIMARVIEKRLADKKVYYLEEGIF